MVKPQFRMLRSHMAQVTAVEADTRHTFPPHMHEQFGIGVIWRGAHRSRSGRGVVEAGAGDVITVNPGEVHDGAPIGERGRAWRMLYVDPPVIISAVHQMAVPKVADYAFHHPVMQQPQTACRFRTLFSLMTAEDAGNMTMRGEEALLLLLASVLHAQAELPMEKSFPSAVLKAKARIDDDPVSSPTLAALAEESGLSRFQLLRGFAKAIGLTPHAYLLQRRIQMARRLIGQGAALAEAAIACGFADQSHMTRIFTRTYGVSPGAYAAALI